MVSPLSYSFMALSSAGIDELLCFFVSLNLAFVAFAILLKAFKSSSVAFSIVNVAVIVCPFDLLGRAGKSFWVNCSTICVNFARVLMRGEKICAFALVGFLLFRFCVAIFCVFCFCEFCG